MAKDNQNFWSGGSWEQSAQSYAPPKSPNRNLTSHIRRSQSIRQVRRRLFRVLRFSLGVAATVAVIAGIGLGVSGLSIPYVPPIYGIPGGGGYYQESSDEVTAPLLPRTEFLEDDLLTLVPGGDSTLSPQEIYQNTQYSVAYIETLTKDGMGAGTGIVVSQDGYIITNAHVISGATQAVVTLWDESYYEASVVGWDLDEDLAILKIEAEDLVPATFGDSSELAVGDTAYAIGNPLGAEYRSTFTDGIISAIDRYLDIDGVNMSLIQTTTPINSGNSGGALLNSQGQVVGITTIKIMSSADTVESMGFAIPSTRVVKVVNSLVQGIEVVTPALGITIIPVEEPIRGLRVDSLVEGSNADLAGIEVGDILTHAAHVRLYANNDLMQVKDNLLAGDTLVLTIQRDGEVFDVEVELSDYATVYPENR